MKLWQRYLLREFFAVFFLFLFGFYFLYIAIDYCSHMQDFIQGKQILLSELCFYYFYQLIKRCDILLPLAYLVAMMKTLLKWNVKNELVAFQAAGLSWKRLVTPLFVVALLLSGSNLLLTEFVLPNALNRIDYFHDSHLRHSHRGQRREPIHVILLKDHSKLIYQYYDRSLERFIDVIWICSPNQIWRMKSLKMHPHPEGYFVDHLEKRDGYFVKIESLEKHSFPHFQLEEQSSQMVPLENHSISKLLHLLQKKPTQSIKQGLKTQILFKTCMPFLPILVFLSITPRCIRYARRAAYFLLYAISLFSFVAFIALMDGFVILGETGTLTPVQSILVPFFLPLFFFSWAFIKNTFPKSA